MRIAVLDDYPGVALQVADWSSIEPLPGDHPFRSPDNLLLTPHMEYGTAENLGLMFTGPVEDMAAYLDGQPARVLT